MALTSAWHIQRPDTKVFTFTLRYGADDYMKQCLLSHTDLALIPVAQALASATAFAARQRSGANIGMAPSTDMYHNHNK